MVLRVGLVGCGGIGLLAHLPGMQEIPEVKLVAVSDTVADKARDAASKFGAEAWYTDYREMLKRDDIDLIDICTPVFTHRDICVAAAQAGKHVLCEKPIARSAAEGAEMVNACREAGVQLGIMFQQRYQPVNKEIRRILEEGQIGRVLMVRGRTGHAGPDVRMAVPGSDMASWVFDPKRSGGGCLYDIGVHMFDAFRWLLGDIASVSAEVATMQREVSVEDNACMAVRFANGAMGVFEVSWSTQAGYPLREFYGTEGTVIAGLGNEIRVFRNDTGRWDTVPIPGGDWFYWHRYVIQDFAQAVLSGRPVPVSGEDGLATLQLIEAAYRSSQEGIRVQLEGRS